MSVLAGPGRRPWWIAAWSVMGAAIAFFWLTNAPQYLVFTEASYGAWWPQGTYLLPHIIAGSLALLLGPFQFSATLRNRNRRLHRVAGRIYIGGVIAGSLAAFGLVATTRFGPTWGIALAMLAFAWLGTTGTALYCIRQRDISQHREWMARSYTVTFAFVMFRILFDYTEIWATIPERGATMIWVSWTVPLLLMEIVIQARKIRRAPSPMGNAAR